MTYLWQLEPVRQIISWEDNCLASSSPCSYRLLSQPANPENLSSQRDFARHGYRWVNRSVQSERQQGCRHRDTSRRPILGDSAIGNMQVHLGLVEEVVVGEFLDHERLGKGVSNRGRFLHDVLEIACDLELRSCAWS